MILQSIQKAPTVDLDLYAESVLENKVQLGWGNGAHTCVGIHLAKLEIQALLRAMVDRVQAIEVGTPERLRNNTLQDIARLPARFRA